MVKLNRNKAAGQDGVAIEMQTALGDLIIDKIIDIINEIPKDLGQSI